MARKRQRRREFGDGWRPATELLILAVLVIDKLTELYRQVDRH